MTALITRSSKRSGDECRLNFSTPGDGQRRSSWSLRWPTGSTPSTTPTASTAISVTSAPTTTKPSGPRQHHPNSSNPRARLRAHISLRVVEHRQNRECRDFAGLLALPTVGDTAMVTTALKTALRRRDHGGHRVGSGLIHHSDAGSQGGFNLSSQHSAVKPSVSAPQALPLGFATQVFCAGGC